MLTLKEILSKDNQNQAMEAVTAKKNGHGEDGVTVAEFPDYWKLNADIVLESIEKGKYVPGVINTYEILGKNGKKREISSLNVIDRFITRMISQKLKRYVEPNFLPHSFAYQDGKGVLDAVKQAQEYVNSGNRYVADIDIRSFFDNIDLELLLLLMQNEVDAAALDLIKKYLFCKIKRDSEITVKQKGLVQGNPMSPILSNLYMHPLDRFFEEQQYRWIRFADDIKIYALTQEQATDIYNRVCERLKMDLKLQVNEAKSGVFPAMNRWILGYEFYKYAGKIEIRKHQYTKLDMYGKWHTSSIQKVNQEYHIVSSGVLNKKDYSVLFENEEQKKYIPIEATEQICIYSDVTISPAVLKLFLIQNIKVIYVDKHGNNMGYFIPEKNMKNASVMLEQVKLYIDAEARRQIACKMELASIHNMRANLRYYNKKKRTSFDEIIAAFGDIMKQINESKTVEEMMLIEGRARKQYYQCFNDIIHDESFIFEKRTKRPPRDEINAMISFGNTLLYNEVLKAIWKTSLDPKIGVVHATNRREYSLNLDIADIFKPLIVDRVIFAMINKFQIKAQTHFEKLEDGSVLLNDKGRLIFIEEFQEKMADKIIVDQKQVTYRQLLVEEAYHFQNYLLKGEKYKPYKYY